MIRRRLTDAGRNSAGYRGENNDCTVRALAKAGNMPYDQAHKIMAEEGRLLGRGGSCFAGILNAHQKNLLSYKHIELPRHERKFNGAPGFVGIDNRPILVHRMVGPNIKDFVLAHPRGRYIVRIKRHAFALVDGVMYDRYKQHAGAIVLSAWEIIL